MCKIQEELQPTQGTENCFGEKVSEMDGGRGKNKTNEKEKHLWG